MIGMWLQLLPGPVSASGRRGDRTDRQLGRRDWDRGEGSR